jgi:hypothetical protein
MDDELNLPTRKSEAEWLAVAIKSSGTAPFFIANRAVHPAGNVQIPADKLRRLPHGYCGSAALVVTTIEAIDEIGLAMGPRRQEFLKGEVVMVAPRVVAELAERPHGGQTVPISGLEHRARDGLRIVVVLTTEKIGGCLDREGNTKRDLKYRRINVTAEMEPLLAGLRGMSSFREGQALLPSWYPGRTAHAVMRDAYREFANAPRVTSVAYFKRIRTEQMQLVRTAGSIYAKVLSYQPAQHDMSAEMRALQEVSKNVLQEQPISANVLQELAHARHDGPTIDELMAAAIVMDINPALVFANVTSFATEFACAQLMGRVTRGIGIWLKPMHCEALRAFMERADDADLEPERVNDTDRAAQRLRDLALHVKTRSGWNDFSVIAKAANEALWLPPATEV